jgi:hypothetical protein
MPNHRQDTSTAAVRRHDTFSFGIRTFTTPDGDPGMEGRCSCAWGIAVSMPKDVRGYLKVVKPTRLLMVKRWLRHLENEHPDYTTSETEDFLPIPEDAIRPETP